MARLLHLAGVEATVFEGEAGPDYRSQGGSLDLHEETGLAAMKDAGLFEAFLELARYDGEFMLVTDHNLRPYMQLGTSGGAEGHRRLVGQRPEIDRSELRRLLTESLPDGMVRWGRHLAEAREGGTLVFRDGSTESGFDLIVGADGAWSKVRRLLSDQAPVYAGVAGHQLRIPDAAATAPEVSRVVNRGSVFAHQEGRKLALQQMGDGSVYVSFFGAVADERWADREACGYDAHDFASVRDAILGGPMEGWHPTLREAVAQASARCEPRSLYMLPVGFTWPHRRGATVIGDAAHLMTPFAGEGVNVALDDARKLAAAIIAAVKGPDEAEPPDDGRDAAAAADALDRAVEAFEKDMFLRTARVTRLTADVTQAWLFTPGTPRSVIASTTARHMREIVPGVVYPFATAVVHTYFFFKLLAM